MKDRKAHKDVTMEINDLKEPKKKPKKYDKKSADCNHGNMDNLTQTREPEEKESTYSQKKKLVPGIDVDCLEEAAPVSESAGRKKRKKKNRDIYIDGIGEVAPVCDSAGKTKTREVGVNCLELEAAAPMSESSETMKKRKVGKVDVNGLEEPASMADSKSAGKKKKKKKTTGEAGVNGLEFEEAVPVSKSTWKKKRKTGVADVVGLEEAVSIPASAGKKKRKKTAIADVVGLEEAVPIPASAGKKKRKKTGIADVDGLEEAVPIPASAGKKKRKKTGIADVDGLEEAAAVSESARKKKKKKKKDKITKDNDCVSEKDDVSSDNLAIDNDEPKRKKKKCKHGETIHKDNDENCKEGSQKKQRKHKSNENNCKQSPVEFAKNHEMECEPTESSTNCKKKKKKKHRKQEDDTGVVESEQTDNSLPLGGIGVDGHVARKKEKRPDSKAFTDNARVDGSVERHGPGELENDEAPKLRKKKKLTDSEGGDCNKSYNSLPFDYSNMDSKPLSTSRSGDREGADQNAKSGQWGTAAFESEARQQKFLRLLGGFKKSESAESKTLLGKLGKREGNCALNREEEVSLNTKLETEFDRAMSFKLSKEKSGGLGFQAPPGEGKKFYIDKTSSNSIKFNDSD